MLKRIHIENLKCFERLSLPLAPLTLLTGFNAGGKSTAFQPLLLLGQAMRAGGINTQLPLNGPLAKLGTAAEVFNEHAATEKRVVVIGVEDEAANATWSFRADDRGGTNLLLQDVMIEAGSGKISSNAMSMRELLADKRLPRESKALFETLRSVVYLSAVRAGSSDTFPSPEMAEPVRADIGVEGEFAPWWFERLLDEAVDETRRHPTERAATLRRQVNAWAAELFPGADANAQKIPHTSLIRLELRTRTTEAYRRPANIGYGLTYAFPLLIALLLANAGQMIIIDSPEAHLHPRAQSAMGRILAHFSAAGVQVLVETHSDHILNVVRLAIQKQLIQSRQVAVHFFNAVPERTTDPAHIVSPFFDQNGNLSEWPAGFFDQTDQDLAALAGWM